MMVELVEGMRLRAQRRLAARASSLMAPVLLVLVGMGCGSGGSGSSSGGQDAADGRSASLDAAPDMSMNMDIDAGMVDAAASDAGAPCTTPQVRVAFPPPVGLTEAAAITVRGDVLTPDAVDAVYVNDIEATRTSDNASWSARIPLILGENRLVIHSVSNTDARCPAAELSVFRQSTRLLLPSRIAVATATGGSTLALVLSAAEPIITVMDLATGNTDILSGPGVGTGPLLVIGRDIDWDPVGQRAVILDGGAGTRLMGVDLTTGERKVLSGADVGSGIGLGGGEALAMDAESGQAYVVTSSTGLIGVDMLTGERRLISGSGVGQGPLLSGAVGLALDAALGRALVLVPSSPGGGAGALLAVDLTTGNRTTLSGSGVGTGPSLSAPAAVAIHKDEGYALALARDSASNSNVLLRIDLATGDRTVVSSPAIGSGPMWLQGRDIALDPVLPRALITDFGRDVVLAVALPGGERSMISWGGVGDRPLLEHLHGLAIDRTSGELLVADRTASALLSVDLATGSRAIRSGGSVGQGPAIPWMTEVAIHEELKRAFVVDSSSDSIYSIDLLTGDRALLSGSGSGAGNPYLVKLAVDRDGRLYASGIRYGIYDSEEAPGYGSVIAVNTATGDRTVIADETTGSGTILRGTHDLLVETWGTRAWTLDYYEHMGDDYPPSALVAIDLRTGARHVIANNHGIGSGAPMLTMHRLAVDEESAVAYMADGHGGVFSLGMATGARIQIAGPDPESGPPMRLPTAMELYAPGTYLVIADRDSKALIAVDVVTGERVIISQ